MRKRALSIATAGTGATALAGKVCRRGRGVTALMFAAGACPRTYRSMPAYALRTSASARRLSTLPGRPRVPSVKPAHPAVARHSADSAAGLVVVAWQRAAPAAITSTPWTMKKRLSVALGSCSLRAGAHAGSASVTTPQRRRMSDLDMACHLITPISNPSRLERVRACVLFFS